MTNKILVPLDGSELATQVLPHAVALAKATAAEVLLVGAIVPTETWLEAGGVFSSEQRLAEENNAASAYLEFAKHSLKQKGVPARTFVGHGRAAEVIRQVAEEEGAGVIAMTTHGRSGLPRLVVGSVANEVARTSTLPVYLVRASETPATDVAIRRILVPIDGSALSESILPVVEDLAAKAGAELVVQRVITPPAVLYPGEMVPSTPPALEDIEQAAKDYVDELASKLRKKGFTASRDVSLGYAADTILNAATQYDVDVIAMSSHGRTGFGRWVMGSVAEGVVARSTRPVLVIRPPVIAKEREPEYPSGSVEVVAGVSAAKVVVPAPAVVERRVEQAAEQHQPEARGRRPERKVLS